MYDSNNHIYIDNNNSNNDNGNTNKDNNDDNNATNNYNNNYYYCYYDCCYQRSNTWGPMKGKSITLGRAKGVWSFQSYHSKRF